ncbi:transcription initiation factor TFIID subunit 11 isoform X3 [Frankliniella occidentalis]|uniref:Transcription initiation factor TFIID subunit 11 isoform X3 n=1 Tax=Frankliniella occidentalis TaxID=133901 RepID=A0A6J1SQQ2_FRAOC|nr:transcription initiation factor TFIID subunit 11 isoform X3 [Frankliniella occidentalis]
MKTRAKKVNYKKLSQGNLSDDMDIEPPTLTHMTDSDSDYTMTTPLKSSIVSSEKNMEKHYIKESSNFKPFIKNVCSSDSEATTINAKKKNTTDGVTYYNQRPSTSKEGNGLKPLTQYTDSSDPHSDTPNAFETPQKLKKKKKIRSKKVQQESDSDSSLPMTEKKVTIAEKKTHSTVKTKSTSCMDTPNGLDKHQKMKTKLNTKRAIQSETEDSDSETPPPTKAKKQKAAKKKSPKKLVKKRNHSTDDDTSTDSDSSTDSDDKKKGKRATKSSKNKPTRKVSSSDEGSESSSDSDSVHHKKLKNKKPSHNTSKKRKISSDDDSSDNTSEQSDGSTGKKSNFLDSLNETTKYTCSDLKKKTPYKLHGLKITKHSGFNGPYRMCTATLESPKGKMMQVKMPKPVADLRKKDIKKMKKMIKKKENPTFILRSISKRDKPQGKGSYDVYDYKWV